jgi:pectin methylesterase-like acyl-CoA thioesterase
MILSSGDGVENRVVAEEAEDDTGNVGNEKAVVSRVTSDKRKIDFSNLMYGLQKNSFFVMRICVVDSDSV